MGIKEKSLTEALSYCALRELPCKDDNTLVWIKAIALVTRLNCEQGYVYVVKGDMGTIRIVKDFGTSSIAKIDEIYPFEFLDDAYMPILKKNNKEERIKWLDRHCVNADESMTIKKLDSMILDIAIKNNLEALRHG